MVGWQITGRVVSGRGQGAGFTSLAWARRAFIERLGVDPHPGTLNLRLDNEAARRIWGGVRSGQVESVSSPVGENCVAKCVAVRIGGRIPGAVVLPQVPGYDPSQVELIAAVPLRRHLGLRDGDEVEVSATDMSDVRIAIFDVDGTLVNSVEGIQIAAAKAAAVFGFRVPIEAVRRALNQGESLWDLIVPEEARGDSELISILRRETMRYWPEVLSESVRAFPGLGETLGRLSDAGFRLAIVTGSRGESFLPLRHAGLMDFFDPVITARDVTRPKPHPDGLLSCLDRIGGEPAEAVYIGDTCDDMRAGRAAGMRTIGVLTGAADGAMLSIAGAERLAQGHQSLVELLLPSR